MTFSNLGRKTPETVWPLHVYMVLQDEQGNAIDNPDDLRTDLYGVAAESPAMGDEVIIRVGDEFQVWRVAERTWRHVFPAEGQATPCSVLEIGLRLKVNEEVAG